MEKQGWKIAAIISTVLLILSLTAIGTLFWVGAKQTYREQVCAYSICGLDKGEHDSYFFAPDDNCFCFNKGELDFIEDVESFLEMER